MTPQQQIEKLESSLGFELSRSTKDSLELMLTSIAAEITNAVGNMILMSAVEIVSKVGIDEVVKQINEASKRIDK